MTFQFCDNSATRSAVLRRARRRQETPLSNTAFARYVCNELLISDCDYTPGTRHFVSIQKAAVHLVNHCITGVPIDVADDRDGRVTDWLRAVARLLLAAGVVDGFCCGSEFGGVALFAGIADMAMSTLVGRQCTAGDGLFDRVNRICTTVAI